MGGRMREEVAWIRLQDAQREAEHRRRFGPAGAAIAVGGVELLADLIWVLVGGLWPTGRRIAAARDRRAPD